MLSRLVQRQIVIRLSLLCAALIISAHYHTSIAHAQIDIPPVVPTPVDPDDREQDIVGGEPAVPGEWPWQAFIRFGPYLCSGTLIHPEWILTAAHCALDDRGNAFAPADVSVRLGEYDRRRAEGTEQDRRVQAVIIHPRHDRTRHDNDVALLHLTKPAVIGEAVNIIHPITTSEEAVVAAPKTLATVTGWGYTTEGGPLAQVLMKVSIPIIPNAQCDTSYGIITDNMICAGYEDGGYDACQGDSGGPLVVPTADNRWGLAGIVSFGYGCAQPRYYGVYARVSRFTMWLSEVIGPSLWEEPPKAPDEEKKGNALAIATLSANSATQLQIEANTNQTITLSIEKGTFITPTIVSLATFTITQAAKGTTMLADLAFTIRTSLTETIDVPTHFQRPITVSLYYTGSVITELEGKKLALLIASPTDNTWNGHATTLVSHTPEQNQIVFTITQPGTYALGVPTYQLFLPHVTRQQLE